MIIYKCIFSGDEMFSDIYPIVEICDGCFYKVKAKYVDQKADVIDGSAFGFNASQEDEAETLDEGGAVQVINVINSCRLKRGVDFDKKGWTSYSKGFCKKILTELEATSPEKAAEFKKCAPVGVKHIKAAVTKFEVYTGENCDFDGSLGYLNFEEEDDTPYLLFFKHAIIEEKV